MRHHLLIALGIALIVSGCRTPKESAAQQKEERVTLDQLSAPARATVEKLTAGGRVDQIDKEIERGKTVYDVEATVRGQHVEFLISDQDGTVLGTEDAIEFSLLPAPVQAAAVKWFGSDTGLSAMKGVEYGRTHYEIAGARNGKAAEVTFRPDGTIGE